MTWPNLSKWMSNIATSSALSQFLATQEAVLYPMPGKCRNQSRNARHDLVCGAL